MCETNFARKRGPHATVHAVSCIFSIGECIFIYALCTENHSLHQLWFSLLPTCYDSNATHHFTRRFGVRNCLFSKRSNSMWSYHSRPVKYKLISIRERCREREKERKKKKNNHRNGLMRKHSNNWKGNNQIWNRRKKGKKDIMKRKTSQTVENCYLSVRDSNRIRINCQLYGRTRNGWVKGSVMNHSIDAIVMLFSFISNQNRSIRTRNEATLSNFMLDVWTKPATNIQIVSHSNLLVLYHKSQKNSMKNHGKKHIHWIYYH